MKPIITLLLASALASLATGCSKSDPKPGVEASATKPTVVTPTPTPPAPGSAAPAKQPLSHYLGSAVTATVFELTLNPEGGMARRQTKTLDEKATKAYLAQIDLTQRADGPLVKCPSDMVVELADASGKPAGTIGFCKGHARFDAATGDFGGIKAPLP